jgi:mannan endo-1,4-beta-mannosidase
MRRTSPRTTLTLALTLLISLTALPSAASGGTLLGIFYGNQGWKMEQVQAVESWQGKKHAVVVLFTNWCNQTKTMNNLFGQQLPNVWNNGNVPMITWEPYICTTAGTPNDVEVRIAAGQYDAYVNTWADRLKTWLAGPDGVFGNGDDRRAYVRLGHEMNGDWYPWGAAMGGNSPADFVAMWRRVVGIFQSKGMHAAHLQWVWAVNHTDSPGFTAEQYFPGETYVDWVAVDGYNWGTSQTWSSWQSPDATFTPMVTRLRAISAKPLAITEVGSTTATASGVSVPAKSQWIADFFTYVAARDVRLVAWFDEDKETDWAVFGGARGDGTFRYLRTTYTTYASYRTAVGSASLVPSSTSNPRLLTDAQFAGQ